MQPVQPGLVRFARLPREISGVVYFPHASTKRDMDRNRFIKAAALLGIVVFLAGLVLFIYAGSYSRFWADDYCYSATVRQHGIFRGLQDWYHTSGNRLSTLVVVAFTDLFGWRFIRYTTLVVLALWVGAWVFFFDQLRRLARWNITGYWLVLLALVEVYFAALLAPDRLQTIYWRMGTFHYTLPMPLLLFNLSLLIAACRQSGEKRAWAVPLAALLSALLAFFAGGLSETFAAMQAGAFFLLLAAGLVFLRGPRRLHAARLLSGPLLGSILMMAIMAQAPANEWRQAVMPPPENPLMVIPYALRFAGDYIFYTLRAQVVPYLVYMMGIATIALLAIPADGTFLTLRSGLAFTFATLLAMYGLIVCSFAPSAYAGLSYPAGRALMPGCFALLVGLGTAAAFLAITVRQALILPAHRSRLSVAASVLLVMLCLYPFRAAGVARSDIAILSVKAVRWDARNAQILQAIGAGDADVQVRQVDVVQSLEDMGPNSKHWINACAAVFYGARSITANP